MKSLFLLVFLFFMSMTAYADFQQGSQTLLLQTGYANSNSKIDFRDLGGRESYVTDPGWNIGAQYLYFVDAEGIVFGLGVDVLDSHLTERSEPNFLPGHTVISDARVTTFQPTVHLVFPKGAWRPYLGGGLGIHRTSLSVATEQDSLVDSTRVGFAASYVLGMDWFPAERYFIGLELRSTYLSKRRYGVSEAGRSFGFSDLEGGLNTMHALLRVGMKWGRILTPGSAHPVSVARR